MKEYNNDNVIINDNNDMMKWWNEIMNMWYNEIMIIIWK